MADFREADLIIQYDEVAGSRLDICERGRIERMLTSFAGLAMAAIAIYLFDVNSPFSMLRLLGVEDIDPLDLTACAVAASMGLIATLCLEKKRPQVAASEKYNRWLQGIIRYFLAYIFLLYGFAKVFEQQFHSNLSSLDTTLSDASGLQITWRFFGYSYAYTLFVASSQIVGSILLFFRRTTTLGAMILLPVISNIVFVNFSHQIPVKLYSCIYLMMTLYLLLIDHRRLKALFWDNKPFEGRATERPQSRKLAFIKYALMLALISIAIGDNYNGYITYSKVTTPLYGAWDVQEYQIGDADGLDSSRWKKVYFESDKLLSIKSDKPRAKVYFWMLDDESHSIRLEDPFTESVFLEGSYEMESDDKILIKATLGDDTVRVLLSRMKKADS